MPSQTILNVPNFLNVGHFLLLPALNANKAAREWSAFPPSRERFRQAEERWRVWIAVDPDESAEEPEVVDRHAAVAKLVQM